MDKENDCVIACNSHEGQIADMKVTEESRIKATQSSHLCGRKRKGKAGME